MVRLQNLLSDAIKKTDALTISQAVRLFKRISNITYLIYKSYPKIISNEPVAVPDGMGVDYFYTLKFPGGPLPPFDKGVEYVEASK